jgi:chorismate synthase
MNTFGHLFRITTWGESHGAGIGVVIDGCPPGLPLSPEDIQAELDLRRPGQSEFTSPRKESDQVEILSGVFEGHTLGTPISLVVYNRDMRPYDYSALRDTYRPGHADYTYQKKYGRRDYRGGGRSSGRETTARVAAGAVARNILRRHGIRVLAFARMIGGQWLAEEAVERLFEPDNPSGGGMAGSSSGGVAAGGPHERSGADAEVPPAGVAGAAGAAAPALRGAGSPVDSSEGAAAGDGAGQALDALRREIYASQVRCPDPEAAERMGTTIRAAAAEKDSVGGIVEVRAYGLPVGLGDPVFAKLDALVAQALLSLGAVKGIEFGAGFRLAQMRGSAANDPFVRGADGRAVPGSNRAGGVAGGISTGLPLVCRAAVKPTASIGRPQSTVDAAGEPRELVIEGRHDPCIVIRLVPVAEHMVNLVLVDLLLSQRMNGTIDERAERRKE